MRKFLFRPRGRGKSLKVIQECFYQNKMDGYASTYIVVADMQRAVWLNDYARKKGYEIPRPISFFGLTRADVFRGKNIKHLIFDDVDDIIDMFARHWHCDVLLGTMTKEDWHETSQDRGLYYKSDNGLYR